MKRICISLVLLALLLTSTACSKKVEKSDAANIPEAEIKQDIDAYGTVKAKDIKNIFIDFPAAVEKVHVKEGQKVKNEDPVVSLNIEEYNAQIRSKKLELAGEQNEISRLNRNYGKSGSSPDLQKLQNDLKSAENVLSQALQELSSKEVLFNAGTISQSELDEFKKSVDAKRKSVEDVKFSIDSLKYSSGTELNNKSTRASLLESELKLMQDKLNKSYIRENNIISDIQNGLVYELGYQTGDIVSSQKKVFSIMDLDSLVVEAEVPEEFIKDVKAGAQVRIIPLADKSREYKGKVTYISSKAVQKNGETLVTVEISIENRDDFLLPEFNVDVKIEI